MDSLNKNSLNLEIQISIILPVYNGEDYIQQCLQSIVNSTLRNFEVIVVDDGSTDKTATIINKFIITHEQSKPDQVIKYIYQQNKGVSAARNLGIEHASKKWITFIDADDLILPEFLNNLIQVAIKFPDSQLIQAGCTNYFKDSIGSIEQQYTEMVSKDPNYILNNIRGLPFSKLYLKSIIDDNIIRFDEHMQLAEDLAFTLDYINNIDIVAFSSEIGYLYRRHSKSITSSYKVRSYSSHRTGFYHLYNSLNKYVVNRNIVLEERIKRQRHIASFLFDTIYSLYENRITRKERIMHLTQDFSYSHISLLKTNPFNNKIKNLICNTLATQSPIVFDYVFNALYNINKLIRSIKVSK